MRTVCGDGEWQCFNRECLSNKRQLCDGVEDCTDGSDESYTHARCPGLDYTAIINNGDKDQSNLAKCEVAIASPPNASFVFASIALSVWPQVACFGCGFNVQIPLSPRPHACTCPMTSKSIRGHECDRQTMDRQTTLVTIRSRRNRLPLEMFVAQFENRV